MSGLVQRLKSRIIFYDVLAGQNAYGVKAYFDGCQASEDPYECSVLNSHFHMQKDAEGFAVWLSENNALPIQIEELAEDFSKSLSAYRAIFEKN